jgi:hypothetical protein
MTTRIQGEGQESLVAERRRGSSPGEPGLPATVQEQHGRIRPTADDVTDQLYALPARKPDRHGRLTFSKIR